MEPNVINSKREFTCYEDTIVNTKAGFMLSTLSHPIWVLKRARQSTVGNLQGFQVRKLFSGLSFSLATTPLFIMMGGASFQLRQYYTSGGMRQLTPSERIILPILSGSAVSIISQPVGFIINQMNSTRCAGERPSICKLYRKLQKEKHITGIYRGYTVTLIKESFVSMMWWGVSPLVFEQSMKVQTEKRKWVASLICGATGALSASFIHPFETIRVRMMEDYKKEKYRSTLQAVKSIVQKEGILRLYRGCGYSALSLGMFQTYYSYIRH